MVDLLILFTWFPMTLTSYAWCCSIMSSQYKQYFKLKIKMFFSKTSWKTLINLFVDEKKSQWVVFVTVSLKHTKCKSETDTSSYASLFSLVAVFQNVTVIIMLLYNLCYLLEWLFFKQSIWSKSTFFCHPQNGTINIQPH